MHKLIVVSLGLLAGFSAQAEEAKPSLYQRMGGEPAIVAIVGNAVDGTAASPATKRSFEGVNLKKMKASIVEQFCQLTGGPCVYKGDPMAEVHKGLNLSEAEFDGMAVQLVAAIDRAGVAPNEKMEFLQLLIPMKPDIVKKNP